MSRPSLFTRVRTALSVAGSPFDEVERAFADYLDDEKKLGRIASNTDTRMLAFTLFGSVHHLFFTQGPDTFDPARVRDIVEAIVGGPGRDDAVPEATK